MKYIGMNISLGEGGYAFLDDPTIIGDTKDKDGGNGQKEVYEDSSFPNLPSKSLIICFLIKFHHPRSIHSVWKSHKKSNFSKSSK